MKNKRKIINGLADFYGDIHSHCNISYGHGSIDDAYENAMMQLDFASVTGHSYWPDIPISEKRLKNVIDYHIEGFKKFHSNWEFFIQKAERYNSPGNFITFISYEWHTLKYGDYNVYYKYPKGKLIDANSIEELHIELEKTKNLYTDCMIIPHHIGYLSGYRGINWETFDERYSPVIEIISMHGCAESDEAPRPYLHSMGPRNTASTMQAGLSMGYHFGVIGSTDHHGAHPGSYGHGLMGVWARSLTREDLWDAIQNRRTWALTGDKISLYFSINNYSMGSIIGYTKSREINVNVKGSDYFDYIDVIKNNNVIKRFVFNRDNNILPNKIVKAKVYLEVGWGEKKIKQDWDVYIKIKYGKLLDVEPRFRGFDIISPNEVDKEDYKRSNWKILNENMVYFHTTTYGNPTITTDSTQGICLEVEGTYKSEMVVRVNGKNVKYYFKELLHESKTIYLDGFLSGAMNIHRLVPESGYSKTLKFNDFSENSKKDFYYIRLRQVNDQWAWSSPIWIESK